jgi:hypothetical protein
MDGRGVGGERRGGRDEEFLCEEELGEIFRCLVLRLDLIYIIRHQLIEAGGRKRRWD